MRRVVRSVVGIAAAAALLGGGAGAAQADPDGGPLLTSLTDSDVTSSFSA